MKDRIKDYFAFNKKEQRGLIILLGLMLLSASVNIFLPDLLPEEEFDISPFQNEVAEFMASVEKQDSARKNKPQHFTKAFTDDNGPFLAAFTAAPFYFDPNDLNEDQWVNMGMKPAIIRNILRYREKGGTFRDKEGFRKIYGMDDNIYSVLEPYIQIKEQEKSWSPKSTDNQENINSSITEKSYKKFEKDTVMIELNSANSLMLLDCRGIGPSFAGRIIKYRERLGGFVKIDQLLEVKGMDSLRITQFREQVFIDTEHVKKIDLNKVTFKEMMRHPYFEYYLVKAIFSYKDEIKAYDSVGQLRTIPVMYEELYEKLEPYLEVKSEKTPKTNSKFPARTTEVIQAGGQAPNSK